MYIVKTTKGITYKNVKSWQKWNLNEAFCQFEWTDDNKLFIIKFEDIEYIEKM